MSGRHFHNLDSLLEAASRGEPLRQAPPGLYRKIEGRLRVRAVRYDERRRLLTRLCAWAGVVLVTVCGVIGVAWHKDLPAYAEQNLPGVLGFYDYLVTTVALHWPHALGVSLAVLGVCSGVALLAAVAPGWMGRGPRRFDS